MISSTSAILCTFLLDMVMFIPAISLTVLEYETIDYRPLMSVPTMEDDTTEDIHIPVFVENSIGLDSPTATMLSVWRTTHRITETAFDALMKVKSMSMTVHVTDRILFQIIHDASFQPAHAPANIYFMKKMETQCIPRIVRNLPYCAMFHRV